MTDPAETVALCLAGAISAPVALARLVLSGMTGDEIGAMLPAGSPVAALHAGNVAGLESLAAMLRESGVDHASMSLDEIRRSFDRAVAMAPEASVAAYSLGSPALLADATRELVGWLRDESLLGASVDVLDVGCGIGRVAASLAPMVRTVLGVDVAQRMIDEARRRHGGQSGLRFLATDGLSLPVAARGMDLVLFVDSMPYLVQAGIADAQVEEVHRVLRPGGALVVLNLSYGDDPERRASGWARRFGLVVRRNGEQPFRLWDGRAYVLKAPR